MNNQDAKIRATDFIESDRQEAARFADAFIEIVNADHDDVIQFNRNAGCRIRDHIENLRRDAKIRAEEGIALSDEQVVRQVYPDAIQNRSPYNFVVYDGAQEYGMHPPLLGSSGESYKAAWADARANLAAIPEPAPLPESSPLAGADPSVQLAEIMKRLHIDFEDGVYSAPAEPQPIEDCSLANLVERIVNLPKGESE